MPQLMEEERGKASRGTRVSPRVVRPAIPRPHHTKHMQQKNGLPKSPASPPACKNAVENGSENMVRGDRKFETFVMTGDMIIQTTPRKGDTSRSGSTSKKSSLKEESPVIKDHKTTSPKNSPKKVEDLPKKRPSRIPKPSTPHVSPKISLKSSPEKQVGLVKKISPSYHSEEVPVIEVPAALGKSHKNSTADGIHHYTPPIDLRLSETPRFPELDIPPDDISSEDEMLPTDSMSFDVENLPPPPEELLLDCMEPPRSHDSPPPPPLPVVMDTGEDYSYNADTVKDLHSQLSGLAHSDEPSDSIPCTVQSHDVILETIEENIQIPKSDSESSMVDGYGPFNGDSPQKEHVPDVSNYDRQSVCSESKVESANAPVKSSMVVSHSAEKIGVKDSQRPSHASKSAVSSGVRGSKSHENYLEYNQDTVTFVDIDFEDKIASSVDALHYDQSTTSIDSMEYVQFQTNSEESSPEKNYYVERKSEPVHMPTFLSVEEPKSIAKLKEGGKLRDFPAQKTLEESPKRDKRTLLSKKETDTQELPITSSSSSGMSPVEVSSAAMSAGSPSTIHTLNTNTKDSPSITNSPLSVTSSSRTKPMQINNDLITVSSLSTTLSNTPAPSSSSSSSPAEPRFSSPNLLFPNQAPQQQTSPSGPPPPKRTSSIPHHPNTSTSSPSHVSETGSPWQPDQGAAGRTEAGDWDSSSLYHQPAKDPHRPSAARLAKRLFHLDGFKKGDIVKHLSKKNEFAQVVGEEYLSYFDFSGQSLDIALRGFLVQLTLSGETQERERVLARFSHRYMLCNPGNFCSEDACHTLTCALMLLNTDLHGQNIGRKMTAQEFVENLADLNEGKDFPEEVLTQLYQSILQEPLQCEMEEDQDELLGAASRDSRYLGHNPFLDIPDPSKAIEYKKGFVMRKCCIDPDGRKTPIGKRGWKMFYATLRDMVIYLHKDEHGFKKSAILPDNMSHCIRIHHALATKASDYKKKQYVFRLQTADWAQYLFQTSDSKECQQWIDTINFVASSLSAPPLPGAVGSQRKFQRQLMPASYTKLNISEQLLSHDKQLARLDRELNEHRKFPPEKGAKSRFIQEYCEKEAYLQFELKRFNMYRFLLQAKMTAFHPELEPSLVEVAIGEVDEPPSPPPQEDSQPPSFPASSPSVDAPDGVAQGEGGTAGVTNPAVRRSASDRWLSDDTSCSSSRTSMPFYVAPMLEVLDSPAPRTSLQPPAIHPKYVYGSQTPSYYETQV